MAPKWIGISLVITLLAIIWTRAMAQSGCNSVIFSMASCLNYISGSGSTTPSSSCCSALANVVQTQPRCLCTIVNSGGGSFGVSINQTRALELPSVCNVKTPPVSQCNVANGPTMAPVGSPESSPYGSPTSSISPSVSGSKTVPSDGATSNGSANTSNGSNGSTNTSNGSTKTMDLRLFVMLLLITASYTSTFYWF